MKVSYNWLQTYFKDPLPESEKLAELITFHAFEIEGTEQFGTDTVFDIKVLPDRAHYALSHRGIAEEISAITKLPWQEKENENEEITSDKAVTVIVEEPDLCLRYTARYIENVTVGPSPAWLALLLETIGQRSINTIVDATNFVMLDIGQPLHAFDADKVRGTITIRRAKKGEKITTLDGKDVELDESILVIADTEAPLAIAGVKGGNRAAVTESTKNIILESASFEPAFIRKVSQKIGIRNDSSKRFENIVPPERTMRALEEVTSHISDVSDSDKPSPITDIVNYKQEKKTLKITATYIRTLLGVPITEKDIEEILQRLGITFVKSGDTFTVTIPEERRDLVIPEDFIEEIGRIYGYEQIPVTQLPTSPILPEINKLFYYSQKIRDILNVHGFSEIYTYALTNSGEVEIQNPLASDKNFLRANLSQGVSKALDLNIKNADLLGLKQIKIFEIGNVFTAEGEYTALAFGLRNAQKSKKSEADELKEILLNIGSEIGLDFNFIEVKDGIAEISLDDILRNLPEPDEFAQYDVSPQQKMYTPISAYPFAVRDIAVFTPEGTTEHDVRAIIEKHSGVLLVRESLFDVFEKEVDGAKKISYAFRLVFQSHEKTLTEEEINAIMNKITEEMNAQKDWQVR
ncbi:phenylalanine--tRNA ligase subunit beta [Candidatus Parcubacteria bacterium]|nr:phenylalanine--tRNA ligase subunit beta [Candidatus Parcubacteria bacterium]